MWNILSHPENPTILLPEAMEIPEGYTLEGQTVNSDYLTELATPKNYGRKITVLAFRNRFTMQEKVMIEIAGCDDPNAEIGPRMNAAYVRASLKDTDNAAYIDLDQDDTRSGVQVMEAQGLIAMGRATEILDSPVQAHEIPTYPEK
jgi:hypothetical protein